MKPNCSRIPARCLRAPAFLLPLLVLSGCGILGPDLDGNGTVRFVDVEGGCWGILTEEGLFEPINLAAEFRVDGLRVVFEADLREDRASPCMIGPLIELTQIRRAEG